MSLACDWPNIIIYVRLECIFVLWNNSGWQWRRRTSSLCARVIWRRNVIACARGSAESPLKTVIAGSLRTPSTPDMPWSWGNASPKCTVMSDKYWLSLPPAAMLNLPSLSLSPRTWIDDWWEHCQISDEANPARAQTRELCCSTLTLSDQGWLELVIRMPLFCERISLIWIGIEAQKLLPKVQTQPIRIIWILAFLRQGSPLFLECYFKPNLPHLSTRVKFPSHSSWSLDRRSRIRVSVIFFRARVNAAPQNGATFCAKSAAYEIGLYSPWNFCKKIWQRGTSALWIEKRSSLKTAFLISIHPRTPTWSFSMI